jgi:uncharacterized protein involved in exopolysaccharide biosynthesis
MKIESIKAQLNKVERQRSVLRQRMDELRRRELAKLPEHVGLSTIDELILVLVEHASPALRERLAHIDGSDASEGGHGPGNTRRARFPSELRQRIRAELEAGGKSVAQISREYGPSHPTIMGWKREWGLTRPRGRSPSSAGGAK